MRRDPFLHVRAVKAREEAKWDAMRETVESYAEDEMRRHFTPNKCITEGGGHSSAPCCACNRTSYPDLAQETISVLDSPLVVSLF